MASRSVKKTTTTTTTTRQSGNYGSVQSPARPPSPARITRMQEKEQLVNLNDRFATYIDRVRYLEVENSRLQVQVRSCEETSTREVTNIKALYEQELNDARKLLDELSKEKAHLQIEVGKFRSQADEWVLKYNKKDRALDDALKKVATLEGQLAELEKKMAETDSHKLYYQSEYSTLKSEIQSLDRQLIANKKQLEEETLLRVDLENRVQSLKEELSFKSQVHEQEMNETRTRTEITMEEVDGRVQQEYDNKLGDALRDMRSQQEFSIKLHREEIESMYETKLHDMRLQLERNEGLASGSHEELLVAKRRSDELAGELNKLRNQNAILESRISELEGDISREREFSMAISKQKDEEINRLRQEIVDTMQEYKDLMEVKIGLDTEIAAYRKLLEGEEERLNISSATEGTPRRTPVRSGKRKRTAVAEEEFTQTGFAAQSSSKGGVEVFETDEEGKYIKLHNTSDKDVSLGGWHLKHVAGDQETSYKFHRTLNLKAGQHVTVWSANSDINHNPPSDLVMKGQRWFVDDSMKSLLMNPQGEEMAVREMSRSVVRTSYSRGGRDVANRGAALQDRSRRVAVRHGDLYQQGDPHRPRDTCAVM